MTSDVTYLPHSLSAYILPELRGSLSQVRERKTKSWPRRRLLCKVGHGPEDSVLHGLTRGVGSQGSPHVYLQSSSSHVISPPPFVTRKLTRPLCQLSRGSYTASSPGEGDSQRSTGSVGARRREAGAARPPLLPQPGPIARHPASRGAWHTLPLPPRVSPMACHPGAAVATDKRTCIPWSSRCMAVSSPCAEWPCDVRLHSKPP